jgi:SNF2 family DNA or RNA helicase
MQQKDYLTTNKIANYVGSTFYHRGVRYFKENRVSGIELSGLEIAGLVKGSGCKVYRSVINSNGRGGIKSSSCSCPIGGGCKHIAALGLAFLNWGDEPQEAEIISRENQNIAPVKSKVASVKKTAWRKEFDKIANNTKNDEQETLMYEMELIFELRSAQDFDLPAESGYALVLRPRGKNKFTGKKSFSAFEWKDAQYGYSVNPIRKSAEYFLKELYKPLILGAANNYNHYYWREQKWLPIVGANAGMVWHLLKNHRFYNIDLVFGSAASIPINIDSKPISVKAAITDIYKGFRLKNELVCDDKILNPDFAIMFGDVPQFALIGNNLVDPPAANKQKNITAEISLFPVNHIADMNVFKLLQKPLAIPESDWPDFRRDYLPKVMRGMEIANLSQKITIPKVFPPILKAVLSRYRENDLAVEWRWRYESHEIGLTEKKIAGDIFLRDTKKENEIRLTISTLLSPQAELFNSQSSELLARATIGKNSAPRFVHELLPKLARINGVEIEKKENTPDYEILSEDISASFNINGAGDPDWFDLLITIKAGIHDVPLIDLLPALKAEDEYLVLNNGKMVDLRRAEFDKMRQLLAEAAHFVEPKGGGFKMSRFQVGWWEEFKNLGIVEKQSKEWENAAKGLYNFKSIKPFPKLPESVFRANLRPYQREGAAWLDFLRENRLGGVLADDMGLGKTVQAIAMISKAIIEIPAGSRKPFLIVAPTSVVENWRLEFKKFAPSLDITTLKSGNRNAEYAALDKSAAVIVSYAILRRDSDKLLEKKWSGIILDEAQFVKNYQSNTYAIIRKLKTLCRIALTGTPMENNLMELWSIFSIVSPGLFPPPEKFREIFQTPIEKLADKIMLDRLRGRVKPFLLRRKKDLVEKELPQKSEQILMLEMESDQRKIYDLYLQKQRQIVLGLLAEGGMKKHQFEILTALMRMRQICLHAGLIDKKYGKTSSVKIGSLMEQLDSILSEGHKVLVFSQFTSFLSLARNELDAKKINYCYLDGSTRNRGRVIEEFQNGKINVFLMSLKAGGVGINLTAADYCIILDPWWNPAVESQAVARSHRIGQVKPVMVYKYIIKNTIEEKVLALQEKKKRLFDNVLENGEVFGNLVTEKDIKNLLRD